MDATYHTQFPIYLTPTSPSPSILLFSLNPSPPLPPAGLPAHHPQARMSFEEHRPLNHIDLPYALSHGNCCEAIKRDWEEAERECLLWEETGLGREERGTNGCYRVREMKIGKRRKRQGSFILPGGSRRLRMARVNGLILGKILVVLIITCELLGHYYKLTGHLN